MGMPAKCTRGAWPWDAMLMEGLRAAVPEVWVILGDISAISVANARSSADLSLSLPDTLISMGLTMYCK